ncbi:MULTISPECIES: 4'-phosphopantetheinyl transferase superfamily protein [unclassified Mesorhizobium]|uniref:4'-phosphopantetheinyl transferase family protein n=1 Tax=unclassified Mesorhizobium TaxID=325217 RepID=UPI001FE14408|nr:MULTISPECIES: 4'-phosphopantetheinyl transferase superfamily protein [unclassified Mesorhizobium]
MIQFPGAGGDDRHGALGANRFPAVSAKLGSEIIVPILENDGLQLLAFILDAEQIVIREIGIWLSEEERRRAEGLRLERDRRRFVATRGQLRRILASRLGIAPSDVELEYGRQGKPHLSHRMPARDLRFSVSRSGDLAVVALSTRQDIGVDIEAVLPVPEADEIAALCFSASEYGSYTALGPEDRLEGFLRRWTRLEAISKALGCGLGQPLSWVERDWAVHSFVPKPGYVGTVVVQNW